MLRFALSIFLSAFLLFQVQPLIGKFILPWFGGSPGVWTTCMLMFQMLLLGGYAYAHWSTTRLSLRRQGQLHLLLLIISLLALPIRERIGRLVRFRLDAISGLEESLRRALAIMAMPGNAKRTLGISWAGADRMWRLAGDTATDLSYYTRRATLGSIYAATLMVFTDDDSEAKAETRAFLDRRIAGVIRFEKAKARLSQGAEDRFSMARFLGRLRYPAN